jgi:hypothetical protein
MNAGKKGVKMILVTDGVYGRYMKSGKQPGEGQKIEATKEEATAGARRWRQHKEGEESDVMTRMMELETWEPRRMGRDLCRKTKRRANREMAAENRQRVRRKMMRHMWRRNGLTQQK